MEGFGHVPRPREFTIDDQSSSEHRSQTATGSFRPRMPTRGFKPIVKATQKPDQKVGSLRGSIMLQSSNLFPRKSLNQAPPPSTASRAAPRQKNPFALFFEISPAEIFLEKEKGFFWSGACRYATIFSVSPFMTIISPSRSVLKRI